MRRVYRRVLVVFGVLAVVLAAGGPWGLRWMSRTLVGVHQRAITQELAGWAVEYGKVETLTEADRAIGMLGYIERYYVPGEGYRSHAAIEGALEAQREETVKAIVRALQAYSGQEIGNDREAWEKWLKTLGSKHGGKGV